MVADQNKKVYKTVKLSLIRINITFTLIMVHCELLILKIFCSVSIS